MAQINRGHQRFTIEPAVTEDQYAMVQSVRSQVFEKELGIKPAPLPFGPSSKVQHLICITEPGGKPVAALTVQDTTGDDALHARYGLRFPNKAKTARYTQFAVLKPYRGLSLNLALIHEAHFGMTNPGEYDYTWLVIPAREGKPSFCRLLGYVAGPEMVAGDLGPSWPMVRDEIPRHSRNVDSCFIRAFSVVEPEYEYDGKPFTPASWIPQAGDASLLRHDEWHAH